MMQTTRRDFMKTLGISFASLALARCIPSKSSSSSPIARIRDCWLRLEKVAEETQKDFEQAEQMNQDLLGDHRSALDDLVAAGEISAAAAEQVQIAFQEATYHIWRSNAPITCYEPVLVDYTPTSSEQLTQQVTLLTELAEHGDIDEKTIAQAQTALERDIAFLSLSNEETQSLYDKLIAAAGDTYNFPSFDNLDMEITPEAMEAARFLVELLLDSR
jgi:hypothetical protein